jgi:hypothetical protein
LKRQSGGCHGEGKGRNGELFIGYEKFERLAHDGIYLTQLNCRLK